MDKTQIAIDLGRGALLMAIKLSFPILVAGLVVGAVISVLQAATQIQEITLTFVPKAIVTGITLVIAGPWMLDRITSYTTQRFTAIPQLVSP